MKIALAQISISEEMKENIKKFITICSQAKNCDLLFFPEIQLSPFFPQYEGINADKYCIDENSEEISCFTKQARENNIYLSPNVYMNIGGKKYDTSLWINKEGKIVDKAKMVHIAQAENFYEQDYYTPSDDGFKVFHTPFGNVGIVICCDRHIPESIRSCALKGADLIIVPTANTKAEPMEMFEWEMRVQAMQNQVFIAMCNRVGTEDKMQFAGESIVIHPGGEVIAKANDQEQLLTCDIDLNEVKKVRNNINYLSLRRPEQYETF